MAAAVQEQLGTPVAYKFGTMIETPRSAVTAGAMAQESDFFSFGTNDSDPDDLRFQPVTTPRASS